MTRLNHHHQPLSPRSWRKSLGEHYPAYLMEAAQLALFMISAGVCTVVMQSPSSPCAAWHLSPQLRRGLIGLAMGLTAMALIYSPWGRRSGAHMNPAVTLAFWRLGRIPGRDACCYMLSQLLGGLSGVALCAVVLGQAFTRPPVSYVVTVPGSGGTAVAFCCESLIAAAMMGMIVIVSNQPRYARWTGVIAGLFIAAFVTWESPASGFSMNPARTVASSLPSGIWTAWWVYLSAPVLGMLAAAEVFSVGKSLPRR